MAKSIFASENYTSIGDFTEDFIVAKGIIDDNIYIVQSKLASDTSTQVKMCLILVASGPTILIDETSRARPKLLLGDVY